MLIYTVLILVVGTILSIIYQYNLWKKNKNKKNEESNYTVALSEYLFNTFVGMFTCFAILTVGIITVVRLFTLIIGLIV